MDKIPNVTVTVELQALDAVAVGMLLGAAANWNGDAILALSRTEHSQELLARVGQQFLDQTYAVWDYPKGDWDSEMDALPEEVRRIFGFVKGDPGRNRS